MKNKRFYLFYVVLCCCIVTNIQAEPIKNSKHKIAVKKPPSPERIAYEDAIAAFDKIVNEPKPRLDESDYTTRHNEALYNVKKAYRALLESLPGAHIGLTTDEVRNETCWGRPSEINKTTTGYGTNEQWVYEGPNYRNNYLYFTNGILTAIQN